MSHIGTSPPSGVKLSCMAFTEPFEAAVVTVAHSADDGDAKADLLALHVPGRLVHAEAERSSGLPPCSADAQSEQQRNDERDHRANSTQPCRRDRTMAPKVKQSAAGMSRMASSSTKLLSGVGFSNGMRRVGVEEAAAVRPELLDGDLRGHGTERDDRLARRVGRGCGVCCGSGGRLRLEDAHRHCAAERLDDALRHEQASETRSDSGSRT